MPGSALLAGVAEVDITPPLGVELAGYGPYEKRVATEVLDPLYARALWLQRGEVALCVITVDLCAVDGSIRNEVARGLNEECGIDTGHIMLAVSHSHSAPSAQLMIGWGGRDPRYVGSLPSMLTQTALYARASCAPAKIGACRQRVTGVGINREQEPLGPIDTTAQLMRVDRADGAALAVVYNFGAHPVVRYRYSSRVSADWPGLVAAYLRLALPGAIAFFLQGPCGNVNAHETKWWWERSDVEIRQKVCDMRVGDVAQRFGDQIIPALQRIETRAEAELDADWSSIELPCILPDAAELRRVISEFVPVADQATLEELRPLHQRMEDETPFEEQWRYARFQTDWARHQLELTGHGSDREKVPLQVLRIGEAALVGWPAEVYVELGLELRQRSPIPLTFVASSANHTVGYIATPAAYESIGRPNQFGLYPVSRTPRIYGTLLFRADVGNILIEETLRALARLRERSPC